MTLDELVQLCWSRDYDAMAALAEKASRDRRIVKTLRDGLKNRDPNVALACVKLFGELGESGTSAIPDLLGVMRSRKIDMKYDAACSLARLGIQGPAALIELSKDRNAHVRRLAVATLMDCSAHEGAVEAILEAFRDPDENVRSAGVELLEVHGIKSGNAVWMKVESGLESPHPRVRAYSAQCLLRTKVKHKTAIQIAIAGLTDRDVIIRRAAVTGLAAMEGKGGISVIEALAAALRDADADVRMEAAIGLYEAGIPNDAAVAALTAVLDDPDDGVRDWASVALAKIGP
jgi:HEAT repeat protein